MGEFMEEFIEKTGEYLGLEYFVKIFETGHRCGYVKISKELPAYKIDFSEYTNISKYNIVVHGGITFSEMIYEEKRGFTPGYWIGFDCAHCGDLRDFESAIKYFGKTIRIMALQKIDEEYKFEGETIKSTEFCVEMCKSLIRQILKIKCSF